MNNTSYTYTDAPGIYLINNQRNNSKDCYNFGNYSVFKTGKLSEKAEDQNWAIFFDGLLFRDYTSPQTDSEYILDKFSISENIQDVLGLEGFYNLIIIHKSGSKGYIFSDALSSRPQYLYSNDTDFGTSPTPYFFSKLGLNFSLNRTNALEVIRFLHNGYDRTLVNEISRILPGKYYEFDGKGNFETYPYIDFSQKIDTEITEEKAVDWMYEICKRPMESVLKHPKLKHMDVHLPLTAGLDSRHLLGQVIELGKTPKRLWHVQIDEKDFLPVQKMSKELGIQLESPSLFELDFKKNIRRWLERSAGLVNFHQFYLLNISDQEAIGFNGQLMDKFLGLAPVTTIKNTSNSLVEQKWAKKYSRTAIMNSLFSDYKELNHILFDLHSKFLHTINGEDWYKMAIYEFHYKSLHYTGVTDTMTSDEYFCFSPGSSIDALRFIQTVPYSIGGSKKIRLKTLKKYFPQIGKFPDTDGIPLTEKKLRPRKSTPPIRKNLLPFIQWVFSGFKGDPAINTEHEWLRKSQFLKQIHRKIVFEGLIFNEHILNQIAAKRSWYTHQAGGFQAWTLMSLLTIEMSYRVLVKQQSIDDAINWLFE